MEQDMDYDNTNDDNGNPAGGYVKAKGLQIEWQDGPLGRGEDRQEPNGAFVETVIGAAKQRLEYYQTSRFACTENQTAIGYLDMALSTQHPASAHRRP